MNITWKKYNSLTRWANIDGRRWYVTKVGQGYKIQKANDGWQTGTRLVAVAMGQKNAFGLAEKFAALKTA